MSELEVISRYYIQHVRLGGMLNVVAATAHRFGVVWVNGGEVISAGSPAVAGEGELFFKGSCFVAHVAEGWLPDAIVGDADEGDCVYVN